MKAVLLVGHGSRDPEGNEQVRQFIHKLKPQLEPSLLVETCFLEFELPTISQGIDTCVMKGASHVIVIPIMLLPAGHSKIHIPAAIDEAKEKYPSIQLTYGRPIGIHEETFEICKANLEKLGENVQEPGKDTAIVFLGRGGSDPDANSELYKIARLFYEKVNYSLVEPAFMGVTDPLIEQGIERCIKLGAKKIVILPYFLFTGILIKRLETLMEELQHLYPEHKFKLAGYFGFHDRLKTIIEDRITEALQGEVKINCDTCQYRLAAMEHIDHHHDHHHHDHHHDQTHDHHDEQEKDEVQKA
ncbi:sirohydrochlorin chelatase [Pseudalkalibacillus sp. A8]|uniref:sirohydrochlorin chelatase n=1 Tax=Pseudalkalibacillus sp. A8 TaxID=3382641 RepID=UPI0038B448FE